MSKRPQAYVSDAADALETFNHRSFDQGPNWKTPPHAYDAVGPLTRLARNLGQAIEQAGYPIDRTQAEGRVAIDDDSGPVGKVAAFKAAQERATRAAAAALTKALEEMWAAAGHMGYDTRGLPEYGDLEDDRV